MLTDREERRKAVKPFDVEASESMRKELGFLRDDEDRSAFGEIATGIGSGFVNEVPRMAGQAMKFVGGEDSTLYDWGESLVESAEERSQERDWMLHPENHNGVTNAFAEGGKMLAPSFAGTALAAAAVALAPVSMPTAASALVVGGLGAVPAALSQGQDTYESVMEKTGDEEKANTAAWKNVGIEWGGETIANAMALKFLGRAFKTFGGGISGKASTASEVVNQIVNPQAAKRFATDAAINAGADTVTEMGQAAGQRYVEQQAGVDGETPWDAATGVVAPSLAMNAMLLPLGGISHYRANQQSKQALDTLQSAESPIEQRLEAAQWLDDQVRMVDAEAADTIQANLAGAILQKQPVRLADAELLKSVDDAKSQVEAANRRIDGAKVRESITKQDQNIPALVAQRDQAIATLHETAMVLPEEERSLVVTPEIVHEYPQYNWSQIEGPAPIDVEFSDVPFQLDDPDPVRSELARIEERLNRFASLEKLTNAQQQAQSRDTNRKERLMAQQQETRIKQALEVIDDSGHPSYENAREFLNDLFKKDSRQFDTFGELDLSEEQRRGYDYVQNRMAAMVEKRRKAEAAQQKQEATPEPQKVEVPAGDNVEQAAMPNEANRDLDDEVAYFQEQLKMTSSQPVRSKMNEDLKKILARKEFVDNKVTELGSVAAVEAFYTEDDMVSRYAVKRAREVFGETESLPKGDQVADSGQAGSKNAKGQVNETENPVEQDNANHFPAAGEMLVGEIGKEIGEIIRRESAPVRLRAGNDNFGKKHIEKRHGKEIRDAGYASVEDFVREVGSNFNAIYKGRGRGLALVEKSGKSKLLYVELEPAQDGSFYDVKSAMVVRRNFLKNKELLWERAQSSQLNEEPPSAVTGQSSSEASIAPDELESTPEGGVGSGKNEKASQNASREVGNAENKQPVADVDSSHESVDGVKKTENPVNQDQPSEPKRIDDFGEVLAGARKHYAQKMADAEKLDIATEPLSKTWPEPDYQALIDKGVDPVIVATIRAMRDAVPNKGRQSWKVQEYVEAVTQMREIANGLLSGDIDLKAFRETLGQKEYRRVKEAVAASAELYEKVGHKHSMKGIRVRSGTYSIFNGVEHNPPKTIYTVEKKAASTAFSHWPKMMAVGDTKEQAIANFKKEADKLLASKRGKTAFVVYTKRDTGKVYIGKKFSARSYLDLEEFDSTKKARAYLAERQQDLEDKLKKMKYLPSERKAENAPRVGEDHLGGQDVTPEMFAQQFGFRGVQFGNYVDQNTRQSDLNEAYDALMDMSGVLGIPPEAVSLNGELGLAFGARGRGGKNAASAHYEPGTVVINLTKRSGAGSLAHEWWHALDNYFARARGTGGYMTGARKIGVDGPMDESAGRREIVDAFGVIMQAISATELRARSIKLDQTRKDPYWSDRVEMSARAFENFIIEKLYDNNGANDYLANIVSQQVWETKTALGLTKKDSYPYLKEDEIPAVKAAFQAFFDLVESRETDNGVMLYSISPKQQPLLKGDSGMGPITLAPAKGVESIKKMLKEEGFERVLVKGGNGDILRDLAKKAFGKNIVFFREVGRAESESGSGRAGHAETAGNNVAANAGQGRVNGFVHKAHKDAIFINVESQSPMLFTLGHELGHTLRLQDPALWKQMAQELRPLVQNWSEYKDRLSDPRYAELTEDEQLEELFGDVIGENFLNEAFWKDMAQQSPTLFERIAQKAIDLLTKAIRVLTGKDVSRFIRDMEQARAIVAKTLVAYSQNVNEGRYEKMAAQHDPGYVKERIDGEAWLARLRQAGFDDAVLIKVLAGVRASVEPNTAKHEYAAVVKLYKGSPLWMKAPNGETTKLNERQWVQTRTQSFKSWFGDWERLAAQERFDRMDAYDLHVPEGFKDLPLEELRAEVKRHLSDLARHGGSAKHPVVGEIGFTVNAAGKVINKSRDPAKLYVGSDIVNVLEGAEYVTSESPKKANKLNEKAYHTLVNKVRVFGHEFGVVLTLKVDNNGQAHYDHIVVENERSPVVSPGDTPASDREHATPAFTGLTGIIRPVMRRVNPETVSALVDDNGEPRVVYHGTNAAFSDFRQSDRGIFFSESREVAGNYTKYRRSADSSHNGVVMPLFVALKNPVYLSFGTGRSIHSAVQEAHENGHDGVVVQGYPDTYAGHDVVADIYIAFDSHQAKSATGNNGDFSAAKNDILYSITLPTVDAVADIVKHPRKTVADGVKKIIAEMGKFAPEKLKSVIGQVAGSPWFSSEGNAYRRRFVDLNLLRSDNRNRIIYDVTKEQGEHLGSEGMRRILKSLSKDQKQKINAMVKQGDIDHVEYADDDLMKEGFTPVMVEAYKAFHQTMKKSNRVMMEKLTELSLLPYESSEFYADLKGLLDIGDSVKETMKALGVNVELVKAYESLMKQEETLAKKLTDALGDDAWIRTAAHDLIAGKNYNDMLNTHYKQRGYMEALRVGADMLQKGRTLADFKRSGFYKQLAAFYGESNKYADYKRQYDENYDLAMAYQDVKGYHSKLEEIKKEVRKLKGYAPRLREQGDWLVRVYETTDDGEMVQVFMQSAKTQAGAERLMRKLENNREFLRDSLKSNFKEGGNFSVDVQQSAKLDEEIFLCLSSDMAVNTLLDKAIMASNGSLEELTSLRDRVLQLVANDILARGFGAHKIKRAGHLIEGYEDDNYLRVLEQYVGGMAGWLSKSEFAIRAQMEQKNNDGGTPEDQRFVQTYVQDALRNSSYLDQIGGAVRSYMALIYLGGKFSTAALNATQNYVLGQAELSRHGAKNPTNRILRAQTDVIAMHAGRKTLTQEELEILEEASRSGRTMAKYAREVFGQDEGVADRGVSGAISWLAGKSMIPFQAVETYFNREPMLLAAFREFRFQGMDKEAALSRAEEVVNNVHFVIGKENRPEMVRKLGAVGTVAYTFQSYTHNYLLWLANRIKAGELDAVGRSMTALAMLGGLSALPAAGDIDDWWTKLFGGSPEMALREWLREKGDDYLDAGAALEDFVMHGIPSLAGVNFSRSLGVQIPFMGADDESVAERFGGVWPGLAKRTMNSVDSLTKGDYLRALENAPFTPEFIANPMRALRYTQGARTMSGKPITDEKGQQLSYSGYEAFLKALGLNPLRVSKRHEVRGKMYSLLDFWNEARSDLLAEYRMVNPADRHDVITQINKFNHKLSLSSAKSLIKPIDRKTRQRALRVRNNRRQLDFMQESLD